MRCKLADRIHLYVIILFMTTIYAITDEFNTIKYVGKTLASIQRRLSTHMYNARSERCKSKLGDWLRVLIKQKRKPNIIKLESITDDADWQTAERKWIAFYNGNGVKLLNTLDGGNGQHHMVQLKSEHIELMGLKSDNHIAKLVGCHRKTISYHREKLGIPAAHNWSDMKPWNKGKPSEKFIPINNKFIALLGKHSDKFVARKANVSRQIIQRWRRQLGIPAYSRIDDQGKIKCTEKL
jgi:hypothetical protein